METALTIIISTISAVAIWEACKGSYALRKAKQKQKIRNISYEVVNEYMGSDYRIRGIHDSLRMQLNRIEKLEQPTEEEAK